MVNQRSRIAGLLQRGLIILFIWITLGAAFPQAAESSDKHPAVLLYGFTWVGYRDYNYLQELHKKGFEIEFIENETLTWEKLKQFNCLVLDSFPPIEKKKAGDYPFNLNRKPFKNEFLQLLNKYLEAGGGVFVLLNTFNTNFEYDLYSDYLKPWEARLPFEQIFDPQTERKHPRSGGTFIYANALKSPVSNEVSGTWFPNGYLGYNWNVTGQSIKASKDWTVVLRGSTSSYTEKMKPIMPPIDITNHEKSKLYFRPEGVKSPDLFAIREVKKGRLALTVLWNIFHFSAGTSWIHDRVMLGKGFAGKPSDFDKLIENTLRWLSEPSLENGVLGGYKQNPKKLVQLNERERPEYYYKEFEEYQNPTPAGKPFVGLVGARTAYSVGKGTVSDYAKAAKVARLDFVVFLEEFTELSKEEFSRLQEDCSTLSNDTLMLIPGFSIKNNIGNTLFIYGDNLILPLPKALGGEDGMQLKQQCFDKDGNLTYTDNVATTYLLGSLHSSGIYHGNNIGYYNFAGRGNGKLPYNMSVADALGVVFYDRGRLIEDLTYEYMEYSKDGYAVSPICVDLVYSPDELKKAVTSGHYLTQATAPNIKHLLRTLQYATPYNNSNVAITQGPKVLAWGGVHRIFSYAGTPFVPERYHYNVPCHITSEVGLKEIRIYSEMNLYRRFLLNGEKEFKKTFTWAFDRQRALTIEAFDINGKRVLGPVYTIMCDSDVSKAIPFWCSDHQNGELWHGPVINFPGPRKPYFEQGQSWDGGPNAYIGLQWWNHPAVNSEPGGIEGWWRGRGGRVMEGNQSLICADESVNIAEVVAQHNYAPGVVANAYHTYGPIFPSEKMEFTMRRAAYLERINGVSALYAMWPSRTGGNLTLMENEVRFKKAQQLTEILWWSWDPVNFAPERGVVPLWAINNGSGFIACGSADTFNRGNVSEIQPGGYVAMLGTGPCNAAYMFNAGNAPLITQKYGDRWYFLSSYKDKEVGKQDRISSRIFVLIDGLGEKNRNMARAEKLREYFGFTGKNGCNIKLHRGEIVSQRGLIDIKPDAKYIINFEIPNPGWQLNLPVGLRFIGFNPNWAITQFQHEGYVMPYYHNGKNVVRNLAMDDRRMVHLAVYPDHAPNTHSTIGHPVVCDNFDLVIEFAMLTAKPSTYHLAINNPTDKMIQTTLKKNMDLPGFKFADTPVKVPPGGYMIVLDGSLSG